MTITLIDDNVLAIGKTWLESVTGVPVSRGEVEINQRSYKWTATVVCTIAERLLRHAARRDGERVTYFRGQNV